MEKEGTNSLLTRVSSAGATTTGLFELAALGAHIGLDVATWLARDAKVLHGLAGVLGSAQKHRVRALGGAGGQLIEGDGLTASLDDASTGRLGESQSSDRHLGHLEQAHVVRNRADKDSSLALLALQVLGDVGQRHGRTVHARHKQALQHRLVKGRVRAASQEAIQLQWGERQMMP